ncbi:MAG TPA: 23S rRNA (uracil(1939)-C(5))-methyltransferase RlmD [Candidatus Absconditabacterales bacterium]|nr:23S rRNA (uracil(1939)-C(5))-methyltransferase RlmD [Candidatus Absconditabacterales bacterium]
MKKHHILENITIEKVGYEGIGLGRFHDGKKLIIKGGALPGMVCDLKVIKSYKDYAECHIVTIHSFDPMYHVDTIKCPHYIYSHNSLPPHKTGCGGCKWQIASYEQQLELKKHIVIDSFRHHHNNLIVLPVIPSPTIRGYRNKIEYSFGKFISGRGDDKQILSDRSLGFHRQGMFGKIVDIDECFLVDERINTLFQQIKTLLYSLHIPVYDQVQHQGMLRHLMVRQAKNTHEIMLIISAHPSIIGWKDTTGKNFQDILSSYVASYSDITTCVLILNDSLADVVSTRDSQHSIISGTGKINEFLTIGEHKLMFDISPQSFFQTNTHGAEVLYYTAIKLSKDALGADYNKGIILDLYCGTGTIGLACITSGLGQQLLGIEETPSAVLDAYENARRNVVTQPYQFISGKVEKLLTHKNGIIVMNDEQGESSYYVNDISLIIVDPPRSGLHRDVVDVLIDLKSIHPHLIVTYISCNPVTLARDMMLLSSSFSCDEIQPMDMFPHTHHIESIAILR